jgi:hypothetical protein
MPASLTFATHLPPGAVPIRYRLRDQGFLPMHRVISCLAAALVAAVTVAGMSSALACACCSNTAQRSVHTQKIDGHITAQLEQLNFGKTAKIAVGERDDHPIPGLEAPVEDFTVTVTRLKDRTTFALRDTKDRAGTLSLVRPQTISIFEVDPRDTEDHGQGPNLYKEWTITTAAAGDGIFRRSTGPNRRLSLVLHGRGNSCTDATSFKHWTLEVLGRRDESYTFYGELTP